MSGIYIFFYARSSLLWEPRTNSPPPPIYLSLVVEGFVCINKMGGGGGKKRKGGAATTRPPPCFFYIDIKKLESPSPTFRPPLPPPPLSYFPLFIAPSLSPISHIFSKIIHTDSTSV